MYVCTSKVYLVHDLFRFPASKEGKQKQLHHETRNVSGVPPFWIMADYVGIASFSSSFGLVSCVSVSVCCIFYCFSCFFHETSSFYQSTINLISQACNVYVRDKLKRGVVSGVREPGPPIVYAAFAVA